MNKRSDCNHDWQEYQIGAFPYIYRKCLVCGRNEYFEMPMCVWKYMATAEELTENIERTGDIFRRTGHYDITNNKM